MTETCTCTCHGLSYLTALERAKPCASCMAVPHDAVLPPDATLGSRDGVGSGDHDVPFEAGHLTTDAPGPFSTRQMARLLIQRGKLHALIRDPQPPADAA